MKKKLPYHREENKRRTVKAETKRNKEVAIYFSKKNITELNELMHVGEKFVC